VAATVKLAVVPEQAVWSIGCVTIAGGVATTRLPFVVASEAPLLEFGRALTVKAIVPAATAEVVEMVNVEVAAVFALIVCTDGEKEYVTPAGRAVVIDNVSRVITCGLLLPPGVTVTV
jgi:hypothetical protein